MGETLRIGLVYELLGSAPQPDPAPLDADAEYEPEETISTLEAALARLGCESVRIGSPQALLEALGQGRLPPLGLDAVLNIAEGYGTRNREAWTPVLLEMAGIPCLGSDALTLSLSLDKAWARDVVAAVGVPVPPGFCVDSIEDLERNEISIDYPLFVKPRWEGTAKGIRRESRVADAASLARQVARVVADYQQPALVEAFLPGAEYTVTLVGEGRPLPVLQRALDVATGIGLHAIARHDPAAPYHLPGVLDAALEAELQRLAARAFGALRCRDYARVDFRLDAAGTAYFLEINPLPTFARDGSFGILAELEGRCVEALLADVLAAGLGRLGLR